MVRLCTESDHSAHIADILERIPRSDQDAVPLHTLCPSAAKSDPACTGCTRALLTLLQVFDAVVVIPGDREEETAIKARSQAATYFLRSLAVYVRKDLTLVSNWERVGVGEQISLAKALTSGAHLVYLMEHKRTVEHGDLSPIRREYISKAVIKAKIRGQRKPVYLVQYDEKAHQFQLIGGRMRATDVDALTVAKREIEEELAQNHLTFPKDYELRELASDIQYRILSPTYGAFSEYSFTTYQAFIRRPQLLLGPNDRWVTLSELTSGTTRDGVRIGEQYLSELEKRLPGGLDGLRLSLDEVQRRAFSEIVKERPLEWLGLVIGILGIILSILFFFLQR